MKKKIRARKKTYDARTKWRDEYVYQVYQMAREGMRDADIQRALGINGHTMKKWRLKYPAFRKAMEDGRDRDQGMVLSQYIYKRLPDHLQTLWDEIEECDATTRGMRQINALLHRAGKRARQNLFVYCWTRYNFAISKALHKIQISKDTFDAWCKEKEFRELVQQITWHKKNFFEEALIKAVNRGETNAIIFANKTFNRDRGYNEQVDLNISGQAEVLVTPVSQLGLSLEERKRMLEHMRANKGALKEAEAEVVDE